MIDKIISTSEMVKNYMEANGVNASQLASASGVSLRSVYRFLNEESKLSKKIASGLNSLIPEISISFLMVYDAKYQTQKDAEQPQDKDNEKKPEIIHKKIDYSKTVRKNCTVPYWLCCEAEKANINFSQVLQNALKRELDSKK
jgi:plasmid maintenance system antidote protein VapI